ncbi:hypothetical protein KZQ38_30465 [Saccharothrix sp. SC076]|nr:hypothetical protein [Saccharothrix obliqua]
MTGVGTRSLLELPKAHLHLHLDGSLRRSTVEEIARREGREIPRPTGYGSFAHFTATITAAAACLRDEADVRRAVREIVEDARAAGVVWLELSVWPGLFRGRLGDYRAAVTAVLEAGRDAAGEVGFGLVLAANRGAGVDDALTVATTAAGFAGDGVVGFGLDGDEASAPAAWFGRPFAIAREAGLLSVPHAGEPAGPESVRAALGVLGADRVMHGVRAVEDPALVEERAARRSTSARRATPCSACTTRWGPTRCRRCSTRVSVAPSTPTTHCCSTPTSSTSTRSPAPCSG